MKNSILILCLCLFWFSCDNPTESESCDDNTEVRLWDICYNIEETTFLSLYNQGLSGTIPTEIERLVNLKYLYLPNNNLSGNIPPEIGNLTELKRIYLDYNEFTGHIPSEIGNLENLETLTLNHNHLDGVIPSEIFNLSNLTTLWLHSNQLSGVISDSFCNLPDSIFTLYSNKFCPPYPDCISQEDIDSQDISNCP